MTAAADRSRGERRRGHLGPEHPVASVARQLCRELHPQVISAVGGVACGRCWEQAIRADERAVVLFGLPREIEPDPTYVDQVAVERACAGEQVRLTRVERATAVAELAARGWSRARVSTHLHLSGTELRRWWPRPAAASSGGPEAA